MRAFQRTSNHDRTTDQTFFIDKSFNPPPFRRSLDAGSLNQKNQIELPQALPPLTYLKSMDSQLSLEKVSLWLFLFSF